MINKEKIMNEAVCNIIKETLSQKEKWLSMDDPFSGAFTHAIKALHKKNLLITSGEFSLSHLKHTSKKKAA